MDALSDVMKHKNLVVQCPSPKTFESGPPQSGPSNEYLATKRRSVFSNPCEPNVQEIVEKFVPPVYEKGH
jgi:hypothetical protein